MPIPIQPQDLPTQQLVNEVQTDADVVSSRDKAHVFHSWSAQNHIQPQAIAGAQGSWFWDFNGTRYLDFSSQLVFTNLGHQHPAIVKAIKDKADQLLTIAPGFAETSRSQAAYKLAEISPGDLNHVFFTNGGAEANENAIRMARQVTGRHKVLSAYRSYHGATHGAISLTGEPRRWASEPAIAGSIHFIGPYRYRSGFGAQSDEQETQLALAHLEEIIIYEGSHNIAAVILETIVGTNGILVPPPGYLPGVRALCDKYGILLIADEVMTGFGRTGEWFGVDGFEVVPDLITCAKGINSGAVPLGAVLMSDRVADYFQERVYPGGLTYSGHPLACAAAVAAIEQYQSGDLIARSKQLGESVFRPRLNEFADRHPSIAEVRGRGCFWGLELVKNRQTKEMLVPFNASGVTLKPMAELIKAARQMGLHLFFHWNVLMICPPLIISDEEVDFGLDVVDKALEIADNYATA